MKTKRDLPKVYAIAAAIVVFVIAAGLAGLKVIR